jgi:uncharacterized RDD family membrane protein YckC
MKKPEYQELIALQSTELFFLESELAGIGGRTLAYSFDLAVRALASLVMYWWIAVTLGSSTTAHIIIGSLLLLANSFYYMLLEWLLAGKTPGKSVAGIRVIKRDGTRISLLDSLLRNILRMTDMLPFGYLTGICVMFLDSRNRRIGDIIADTIVVYDRPKHRDLEAYLESQLLTDEANPRCTIRGVDRLGPTERTIVKDLYARLEKLEPNERHLILDKFKDKIISKLDIQGSGDPEVILYEIYKKL